MLVYQNILERIQQLTEAVENDEEFYALVQVKTADNLPPDSVQKERYAIEKRMAELSSKVRKLFDGHTDVIIDDRNYEMLMKDIQSEQAVLAAKLAEIVTILTVKSDTSRQLKQLKLAVSECINITELTPPILNKPI